MFSLLLALAAVNSAPQPVPFDQSIPAARDTPYPGTMIVRVDATDLDRAIFRVEQTIPVAGSGPLVLLIPKWLPGNHGPTGQIDKVVGLVIKANGRTLRWTRDVVDGAAFHIDVPEGARALELTFQFVSATAPDQGRIMVTREMTNIQWETVSFIRPGISPARSPSVRA